MKQNKTIFALVVVVAFLGVSPLIVSARTVAE